MSMSRRRFIKQAVAFFTLLTGGGFAAFQALKPDIVVKADTQSEGEAAKNEAVQGVPAEELSREPLLSFFLLSDLHISVGESSMTDKLLLALKDITDFESKVDTIVLGGDLTDFGRESDYRLLRRTMDQYSLPPVYGNMGNHDYYDVWLDKNGGFSTETAPNGKTDAMSRQRFMSFIGYDDVPYRDE